MTLKMLGNKILVSLPEQEDEKTEGGVILTEANREHKHGEGTVIAVGPGVQDNQGNIHPIPVKAGDKILYNGHNSLPIKYNNNLYLIIIESDLFAII